MKDLLFKLRRISSQTNNQQSAT